MNESLPFEVTTSEAAARLAGPNPPLLLDVRESWELATAAVAGADHVPMGSVPQWHAQNTALLDPARVILVLCHHGRRSATVTAWLRERGVSAQNIGGGIEQWSLTVDPAVPRY